MELSDAGEFGLIERIARRAPTIEGAVRVRIGVGDDAAVVDCEGPLVLATDMLVEDRHFRLATIDPADLAYKAFASNVSDLAAMGAVPGAALLSIALSERVDLAWFESFADGIAEACSLFGVALVGGDTTKGGFVVINVAITGSLPAGRAVERSGARPGDLVCVTGSLGGSAAWLAALDSESALSELGESAASAKRAHDRPSPRVREGVAAAKAGASAMIDISDGLLADLKHIAEASRVAIDVDPTLVPVAPAARLISLAVGGDALEWALTGGEDYELAMTVSERRLPELQDAIQREGTPLTLIGTVREGSGLLVGGEACSGVLGWDHFAGEVT